MTEQNNATTLLNKIKTLEGKVKLRESERDAAEMMQMQVEEKTKKSIKEVENLLNSALLKLKNLQECFDD